MLCVAGLVALGATPATAAGEVTSSATQGSDSSPQSALEIAANAEANGLAKTTTEPHAVGGVVNAAKAGWKGFTAASAPRAAGDVLRNASVLASLTLSPTVTNATNNVESVYFDRN